MNPLPTQISARKPFLWLWVVLPFFVASFVIFPPEPLLYADHAENFSHISRGFTRVLGAAFQIPLYLVRKTLSEPPGLGTVDGALTGTFYAVKELSEGIFQIGAGAAPYAKYALFFI